MIVLDTHVWVWWVAGPEMLSDSARSAIDVAVAGDGVVVSAMSAWEVAMLVRRGRLELTVEVEEWIATCEALPFFEIVPVDARIALRSVSLPEPLHRDPADRLIVATTLELDARLITADRRLRAYPGVRTIW